MFIDSGAFIAALVRDDARHQEVAALFAGGPARWATSVLVVSETYSWLLHRIGEEGARTFRALLADLEGLHVHDTDDRHRVATAATLDRLRGRKLTWVDASSLALLAEHRIPTVWGTDHHLGLEGARVVPGPR